MSDSANEALHPRPAKPLHRIIKRYPAALMTREHLHAAFGAQQRAAKNRTPFGIAVIYRNPEGRRELNSADELLRLSNVEKVSGVNALTMHEDGSFLYASMTQNGLFADVTQSTQSNGALDVYEDMKYALDSASPPPKRTKTILYHDVLPAVLMWSLFSSVAVIARPLFPSFLSWILAAVLILLGVMFLQGRLATALKRRHRQWLFYSLEGRGGLNADQRIQIAMIVATIAGPITAIIIAMTTR